MEVDQDPPAGSNLHVGPGTMKAVERTFVDHWHEAGSPAPVWGRGERIQATERCAIIGVIAHLLLPESALLEPLL